MRHASLLKIPGARFGERNEFLRFQVNQAQRCRVIFGRQPILDRRFQNRNVSLIRAPGIDAIIAGKEMLFGPRRDGHRFGGLWEDARGTHLGFVIHTSIVCVSRIVRCLMEVEQYMHEIGAACNAFIVVVLVRRLGQWQTTVKKELDAEAPKIVGAIQIFAFPGDAVAVDQQCNHVCDRFGFHEIVGVRCRSEIPVCCREDELSVFVCERWMACLYLFKAAKAAIGYLGVYLLPIV